MSEVPLNAYRTHGDLIFTSGQVGLRPDGSVPEDFGDEVRLAMLNLAQVLAEADSTLIDVLKSTVYITDADLFGPMNEVYAEHFDDEYPARTTIVTTLARPELRFEIEAVAYKSL